MILSPGDTFGAYTIVGTLGAGGMGEVYRARDERLKRDVALKVLAAEAARDPGRVERFEVEARAASALNHPSIVVVYEIGAAALPDGQKVPFLAMECLDGEPLSARIPRGGLPLREFLSLASDLTDGLARAHESGILHRDLKPSNLYVTPEGRLKILDFGLAKLRRAAGDPSPASTTDTLTSPGTLLGTVGYLSPEQLRGESATFASDQFSAGCVLYEMLAGRRAFPGTTPAEIVSAILRDDPLPLDSVRTGLPPPLVWVVERCLAKFPRERYGSTADLARDIRTLKEHSGEVIRSSGSSPRLAPPRIARRGILAAALVAAGAALAAVLLVLRPARPVPEFRRLTFREGIVWKALFDPRSSSLLYTAAWEGGEMRLYRTAPEVAGMDQTLEAPPLLPLRFAEDGSRVLALLGAGRPALNISGTLAWLPSPGGTPRSVAEEVGWADARGNVLVAVRDAGDERILELRGGGGGPVRPLFATAGAFSWVRISPDGSRVAFFHHPSRGDDAGAVVVVPVDGSSRKTLTPGYGHAAGLDWNGRTGEVWFTAQNAQDAGGTLFGVSLGGRVRVVHRDLEFFTLQAVADDGRRVALSFGESRSAMIVRTRGRPLRNVSWLGWSVVCDLSPDGRTVLFTDVGTSSAGAFLRPTDGSGTAVPLGAFDARSFSPDGTQVVGLVERGPGGPHIVLAPVGVGPLRPLTSGEAAYDDPVFAGPEHLLALRHAGGSASRFVLVAADGRAESDLGPADCRLPAVDATATKFACVGASDWKRILVRDLAVGAAARVVFSLPDGGERILRVRWDTSGTRLLAATTRLRLLTIDVASGGMLDEETLSPPPGGSRALGVAASADGALVVYSVARESAALYLGEGLE